MGNTGNTGKYWEIMWEIISRHMERFRERRLCRHKTDATKKKKKKKKKSVRNGQNRFTRATVEM